MLKKALINEAGVLPHIVVKGVELRKIFYDHSNGHGVGVDRICAHPLAVINQNLWFYTNPIAGSLLRPECKTKSTSSGKAGGLHRTS